MLGRARFQGGASGVDGAAREIDFRFAHDQGRQQAHDIIAGWHGQHSPLTQRRNEFRIWPFALQPHHEPLPPHFGDNLAVLEPLSQRLVRSMQTIEGLEDVKSSLVTAQPVLGVRINRDAASDLGVSLQQIGATLRPMLGGDDVSDWTSPDGRSFTVTVRLPAEMRNDLEVLRALSERRRLQDARADELDTSLKNLLPPEALTGTTEAAILLADAMGLVDAGATTAFLLRWDVILGASAVMIAAWLVVRRR